MLVHIAKSTLPMGMGLPVILNEDVSPVKPGDSIQETVWGRVYLAIKNPTGAKLEIVAASAGTSADRVCFTLQGDARDFAFHKAVRSGRNTVFFKSDGHIEYP